MVCCACGTIVPGGTRPLEFWGGKEPAAPRWATAEFLTSALLAFVTGLRWVTVVLRTLFGALPLLRLFISPSPPPFSSLLLLPPWLVVVVILDGTALLEDKNKY